MNHITLIRIVAVPTVIASTARAQDRLAIKAAIGLVAPEGSFADRNEDEVRAAVGLEQRDSGYHLP